MKLMTPSSKSYSCCPYFHLERKVLLKSNAIEIKNEARRFIPGKIHMGDDAEIQ